MNDSPYRKQVELLLRCLPEVGKETCFALKGGTAINLFVRDFPRLSVDIDLAFLPRDPWNEAILAVESSLQRMAANIQKSIKDSKIILSKNASTRKIEKIFVRQPGTQIKIEPNPVIRGSVFPSIEMTTVKAVEDQFGMEASLLVLSQADLYGGKLVAALDRQHPRDLFDTKLLMEAEGISTDIRKAFVIYLACHSRPIHEVVSPTLKDKSQEFEKEFAGMTSIPFSYKDFETTRAKLIEQISKHLTKDEKDFLISIQEGRPRWALAGVSNIEDLPALTWKAQNVQKMDANKRKQATQDLKSKLGVD
jgi:predicted nucleotidyltransferase component of viral defense system